MGKQAQKVTKARRKSSTIPNMVKQDLRCLSHLSIDAQANELVHTYNYTKSYALNLVKKFRGVRRTA